MESSHPVLRLAAAGDIHCHRKSRGILRPVFAEMSRSSDVVVLCGDLTDYGLPEEARILVDELSVVNVPVVAVLGNHDCESNKQDELHKILADANVTVLDGDSCEIKGVGFAGVKGFAGGFGNRALEAWGEGVLKQFVQEAANEALKLEAALARLETKVNVAVLHYSPIHATVEGEPAEIIPFLGSRRLEEPLNRFPVHSIFHGHAHFGTPEGMTEKGTPVYNVAMPLLRRKFPGKPAFRVVEVPLGESIATLDGEQAREIATPRLF
jgi:Icc-related predicted phosphoesterase